MAFLYEPPPSPLTVLDLIVKWVARTQGVKVTVLVEGRTGESATVIDGRRPPLDVCTDPDNCARCRAMSWEKHKYEHAGIPFGAHKTQHKDQA